MPSIHKDQNFIVHHFWAIEITRLGTDSSANANSLTQKVIYIHMDIDGKR